MFMQIGYSENLKLSDWQKSRLRQWIGSARYIWNSKIEENNYYYNFGKKFVPVTQWRWINKVEPEYQWLDQRFARHKDKELTPWLSQTPSTILRNSATNWSNTQVKFMKGECGAPRKKHRSDGGSIWLTNDTFQVLDKTDKRLTLMVGQKKNNIGVVVIRLRKPIESNPNSITIKVDSYDRWRVSFSFDDMSGQDVDLKDIQKEWKKLLLEKSESEISEMVLGIDRGIKIPVATPIVNYEFSGSEKKKLEAVERYKKKQQRKLARQKKGSKRRNKTKSRIARLYSKQTNIKKDFAHKTTHALVNKTDKSIFILENLNTKNMTKSAKGTKEKPGKKVRQKSGLNREILSVGWHRIETYLSYKAVKAGKIVFKVSPNHTSQECSSCGYTHKDNRPEQEKFVCGQCGHTENADTNASKVLGHRAVKLLIDSGTELSSKGVLLSKEIKSGGQKAKIASLEATTQKKRRSA